jgi:hypothetical protein
MSSFGTSFRDNLRSLYENHGGPKSFVRSAYFWIAVVLVALCWRRVADQSWVAIAQGVLPTLAGFSIASFAILFAILTPAARRALRAPAPELGGRSPLLVLASTVSHAVVVQVTALIFGTVFAAKPFPYILKLDVVAVVVNTISSGFGLFLLLYGIVLVLASVLTIFKILEITP